MSYTAEISRSNPSCFLFLVDRSGSMSEAFAGHQNLRKCDSVADAINKLVHNLILKCARGEGVRHFYDVGVIGYGQEVTPAFSGPLAGRKLVSIGEVAAAPARVEERTRSVPDGKGGTSQRTVKFPIWFEPVAKGMTPMGQALDMAREWLTEWVGAHMDSHPPIVINITDGEATDSGPMNQGEALKALATNDGNTLLFNCHISGRLESPILFPQSEAELPDELARTLFSVSSELPEPIRKMAQVEHRQVGEHARGFAFNADLVELIRFLDIGTRAGNLR